MMETAYDMLPLLTKPVLLQPGFHTLAITLNPTHSSFDPFDGFFKSSLVFSLIYGQIASIEPKFST